MGQGWRSGESQHGSHQRGPGVNPRVDATCGLSLLLVLFSERFFQILWLSDPLLKKQHFQVPIRSGTHGHVQRSFLRTPTCFVGKRITKLGKYNKGAREVRVHMGTCTLDKSLIDLLKYLKD